jgi:LmbE family N-acetylglucosaminyl deacetylase
MFFLGSSVKMILIEMPKILFVEPHPDDLELNCGHIIHYLAAQSKNKNIVKIISITKGEFGLPGPQYDKFKGDFLAKVRVKELISAESLHGIPEENIEFFGYVDGLVPFNREIINRMLNYLQRERPDIIFAPEPIYTYYPHNDHVNAGRVVYYIIDHHLLDYTPNLYLYSSLGSNFYFGFTRKDLPLTDKLLACHKTQYWLLNGMKRVYLPVMVYYAIRHMHKISGWGFGEPFRKVYFHEENQKKNFGTLGCRIWSHFYNSMPFFVAKYPEGGIPAGFRMIKFKRNK